MTTTAKPTSAPTSAGKLILEGKEIELPVVVGTENERGLDISSLLKQTGHITLDEGYMNPVARRARSPILMATSVFSISRLSIEEIAEHCDFVETSFLLIYGKLPNATELAQFRESIRRHTMIHEDMRSFYNGFPKTRIRWRFCLQSSVRCRPFIKTRSIRMIRVKLKYRFIACLRSCQRLRPTATRNVWPAVHVSAQRIQLLRELLAADVRGSIGRVRTRS